MDRVPARNSTIRWRLSPSASAHLDAARALAAWIVLVGHIRVLFFVDYGEMPPGLGVWTSGLYWMAGLGRECVVMFFVLSGFLISRTVARSQEDGNWSWREYVTDRLIRLYIVLIPGLLLGVLWDGLGLALPSTRTLYTHTLKDFGVVVAQQFTPGAFIGNLAFVQTILCQPFGSNGPLWSLANEFWYYMLFPAILLAARRWRDRNWSASAVAYGGAALLIFFLIGPQKVFGFVVWLFGFGALLLNRRRQISPAMCGAICGLAGILLAAALGVARRRTVDQTATDFVVGLTFALLVYGLMQTDTRLPGIYLRVARGAAGFSYSLYVLHFPLILFVRAVITPEARWQPDELHLTAAAAIVAITVAYAYVLSRFTEAHTDRVRSWIRRRETSRYWAGAADNRLTQPRLSSTVVSVPDSEPEVL